MDVIGYILLAVLALVWWVTTGRIYRDIMNQPKRMLLAEAIWWYRAFVFVTTALLSFAFFTGIVLILVGVCKFWVWLLGM